MGADEDALHALDVRKNQAARIRLLLAGLMGHEPHEAILLRFFQFISDHPFPAEPTAVEVPDSPEGL